MSGANVGPLSVLLALRDKPAALCDWLASDGDDGAGDVAARRWAVRHDGQEAECAILDDGTVVAVSVDPRWRVPEEHRRVTGAPSGEPPRILRDSSAGSAFTPGRSHGQGFRFGVDQSALVVPRRSPSAAPVSREVRREIMPRATRAMPVVRTEATTRAGEAERSRVRRLTRVSASGPGAVQAIRRVTSRRRVLGNLFGATPDDDENGVLLCNTSESWDALPTASKLAPGTAVLLMVPDLQGLTAERIRARGAGQIDRVWTAAAQVVDAVGREAGVCCS